jgi:hypothetical protein
MRRGSPGYGRELGVKLERFKRYIREIHVWRGTPIDDTPINGVAKIFCQRLKGLKVKAVGSHREFCKGCHSITNIDTTDYICKENLTKKGAVFETKFLDESRVFGSTFSGTRRIKIDTLDIIWIDGGGRL